MIHINDVTYRLGDRLLLEKATAAIPDGARVGFIGRNGTGKTTLFKIITGDLGIETGGIQLPRLARIGKVEQEAPGGPDSLLDFVLKADIERNDLMAEAETATDPHRIAEIQTRLADIGAHAAPARAAAILSGLGFDTDAQSRPCSDFSGGWRMRVALAAVLFLEPDLLLLDEPTNYLDLEGTVWLQNYLSRYPHTTITISHDRDFLDSVADHILHLEQGKLTIYRGNYAGFARQYAEKKLAAQRAIERQMTERRHMEAFVERFRAKASKAKQAQSRLKRLARMQEIAIPPDEDEPELHLPSPEKPLAPPLIAFDNVSVGYGDRVILRRINTSIGTDERIGLLGSNGNGKSTLVKLIAGRLAAMDGTLKRAGRFDVGYFAQHQLDELDGALSPYQVVRTKLSKSPFPLPSEAQIRSRVAALGFGSDKADRKISSLSGGEKARLLLGMAAFDKPPCLILDEPTNHLDIRMREALIAALADYQGAVIIVSHDRSLIDATCDRLWLVAEGTVKPFDGDLDDYTRLVLDTRGSIPNAKLPSASVPNVKTQAQTRVSSQSLKRRIEQAEAAMVKLAALIERVDEALAKGDVFRTNPDRAEQLSRDRAGLQDKLEAAELEWLAAQEALDKAA